uniref:Uncharacterized protein n=1 Tax=Lepeophtheirus salmonis TaxID=72036 RepID=A0A0K2TYN2_LEPSM
MTYTASLLLDIQLKDVVEGVVIMAGRVGQKSLTIEEMGFSTLTRLFPPTSLIALWTVWCEPQVSLAWTLMYLSYFL